MKLLEFEADEPIPESWVAAQPILGPLDASLEEIDLCAPESSTATPEIEVAAELKMAQESAD
jgi:hypothetical protein